MHPTPLPSCSNNKLTLQELIKLNRFICCHSSDFPHSAISFKEIATICHCCADGLSTRTSTSCVFAGLLELKSTEQLLCSVIRHLLAQTHATLSASNSPKLSSCYKYLSRCWQNCLSKKFKPSSPPILETFILKKLNSQALSGRLVIWRSSGE